MLQKNTVEKTAFELLRKLMQDSQMDQFFLVGGTSIALRLGHRKSIDLDLFTQNDISVRELNKHLSKEYGFIERYKAHNTLKGEINGVFIDCIKYDYPLLKPLSTEENIRIASFEDVIAMKLSAITDNGTRLKDFVDISFLSTKYSLEAMLDFYLLKYKNANVLSVVKALSYFDDIDFIHESVNLMVGKFNWEHIEKRLYDMIKNPQEIYTTYPI